MKISLFRGDNKSRSMFVDNYIVCRFYFNHFKISNCLHSIKFQIAILIPDLTTKYFLENCHSWMIVKRNTLTWRNEDNFDFNIQIVVYRDTFDWSFSVAHSTFRINLSSGIVRTTANVMDIKLVHHRSKLITSFFKFLLSNILRNQSFTGLNHNISKFVRHFWIS
jgi:hypothetical protein